MLFKPDHVAMILAGAKTQTRRAWRRPMAKVGGRYKVKTAMLSKEYHCLIEVVGIRRERLADITEEDANREGYPTVPSYFRAWSDINNEFDPDQEVYVIDFQLAGEVGK